MVGLVGPATADWATWYPAEYPYGSLPVNSAIPTNPRIVVNDDAYVHVAYVRGVSGVIQYQVYSAYRSLAGPGGAWYADQAISNLGDVPTFAETVSLPDIDLRSDPVGRNVYVVWQQVDSGSPFGAIYLQVSEDAGTNWLKDSLPPFSPAPIQVSNSADGSVEPAIAVDEDFVYIAWSQVYGVLGNRIAVRVYERSVLNGAGPYPSACADVLFETSTYLYQHRPRLVVDKTAAGHIQNLVFQSYTDDQNPLTVDPWEVYTARSVVASDLPAAQCGGWPASPTQLSNPSDTADSMKPDIAHSAGQYLHVAWEDYSGGGDSRIRYRQNQDLGAAPWGAEIVIAPTPPPDGTNQREPSVASCSGCVAVAYTQDFSSAESEIYFTWSLDRAATWKTPIDLSNDADQSQTPSLAVDEKRGATDFLYNRMHMAWNFRSAGTGNSEAQYRHSDKAEESGTSIAIKWTGPPLAPSSGTAAAVDPATGRSWIFGGVIGGAPETYSSTILQWTAFDLFSQVSTLPLDSGKAWMPAVWVGPSEAYVLWGKKDPTTISGCITVYNPSSGSVACIPAGPPSAKRWGASAVYDGVRYIYVFGGSTNSGAPVGSRDIIRVDMSLGIANPAAFLTLCQCLPGRPTMHSAAVWDAANGVAYVIQGVTNNGLMKSHLPGDQDKYIIKVVPGPSVSVEIVGRLPTLAGTGWGTPGLLETDEAGDATSPRVAVNPSGNGIAVWAQSSGARTDIWSNLYSSGWGSPTLVETAIPDAFSPQVAMDLAGNALAVWRQGDDTVANRYSAGSGWGTASSIDSDTAFARHARVAMDSSGNGMAVWLQTGGGYPVAIWANRYLVGTGWGTAVVIGGAVLSGSGVALPPDVSLDGSGNAFAVWPQYVSDALAWQVVASRFVPGTGWDSIPVKISGTGQALSPRIATGSGTDAMAIWQEREGVYPTWLYNIKARRYLAGSGWGTTTLIETGNAGDAVGPSVAVDSTGTAVAAWLQGDGTRTNTWANRFVPSTGWGGAVRIELDDVGSAIAPGPEVAMNGAGVAAVVWTQIGGTQYDIWSNRFIPGTGPGTGWGQGTVIETGPGSGLLPDVGVDGTGNAVAVWQQDDASGPKDIRANRFVAGVEPEPTPSWKFSAVYDANIQRVVIFGGGSLCEDTQGYGCGLPVDEWYYDTIYRFNPATKEVFLDPCLRLPSKREGTSATFRWIPNPPPVPPASSIFGGATGGNLQGGSPWVGLDQVVRYVG